GLYLGIVLVWSSMATSIAVITRSVAAAVATPITWMLLIEQLLAQIPMFDAITPWLPFAASHSLLARSLGEATSVYPALATAFAILSPAFLLGVLSFTLHCKRDAP
ncbi:TPA: ABC transporter permease, partial [Corynebacterium striatum]|nr:ABC transporter permease [Corynebacterium striatum]